MGRSLSQLQKNRKMPEVPRQLGSSALRYAAGRGHPREIRRMAIRCRERVHLVQSVATRVPGQDRRDHTLSRLEAVLFLAKEPLSSRRLSQYANLADGTAARTLVRRLSRLYDRSGRAFRIEEAAGGIRLLTRSKFARWLRRLGHVPVELRLSAPAMETLSVVAYRQPVPRADIETVRGVSCGEILRQLMERDLVRIAGRSHELGRPYLYGTTKHFLELFGLRSINDLPRIQRFRTLNGNQDKMRPHASNV